MCGRYYNRRELVLARWASCLSSRRALPTSKAFSTFNARAESIPTSATRRCLVPAEGFYEWKTLGDGKKPAKQPFSSATGSNGLRNPEAPPPLDLLRPFDADAMKTDPCNPLVGNVRNNGPETLNSA